MPDPAYHHGIYPSIFEELCCAYGALRSERDYLRALFAGNMPITAMMSLYNGVYAPANRHLSFLHLHDSRGGHVTRRTPRPLYCSNAGQARRLQRATIDDAARGWPADW
jgi:hypothetical protein